MFQAKNFQVHTFLNDETQSNMYVITFENNFFVVDPCVSFVKIKDIVGNKKCVGVFLTHAHYDHFLKAKSFIDQNFVFYMHQNAKQKILENDGTCIEMFKNAKMPNFENAKIRLVKQNDLFEIEDSNLRVIELFGHSNCSIGFLIDNCFFVGDCIFAGGNIGRYDLKTGSGFQTRATLRKLKTFDLYLNVFSGHGEPFMLKDFWNR